jgi:lysophospholipase L1-like esterase
VVATIRALGVRRVYAATLSPAGRTGAVETQRLAINTWLRTRPGGLADVFEFDRPVASTADVAVLDAAVSADGLHMKAAGYSRLARAVPTLATA